MWLLLVLPRPPVQPAALVDTEALSQGCSSALLFRDNDKALNPSVDLTFVPPLFLNCLVRSGVAIWPVLGGLCVCLGRGDSRSPPLFGLATPQPPHSCRQNPAWSTRYPKSLCGVCCGGGKKWGEKKKEKRKVYFCLRRTFRVWNLVTQTCYRRPFKRDWDVYVRLPLLNCYQQPFDWDLVVLRDIFKQYCC